MRSIKFCSEEQSNFPAIAFWIMHIELFGWEWPLQLLVFQAIQTRSFSILNSEFRFIWKSYEIYEVQFGRIVQFLCNCFLNYASWVVWIEWRLELLVFKAIQNRSFAILNQFNSKFKLTWKTYEIKGCRRAQIWVKLLEVGIEGKICSECEASNLWTKRYMKNKRENKLYWVAGEIILLSMASCQGECKQKMKYAWFRGFFFRIGLFIF